MKVLVGFITIVVSLCSMAQELNYIKASDNNRLGEAQFEIDEDTKTLIVTADEQTNKAIAKVVAALDRPVEQVLIKVLFLEVEHSDGINLGVESSKYDSTNEKKSAVSYLIGGGEVTQGGTVSILNDDLEFTLNALSETNTMEVLSRPSIMARNNRESNITIGSEVPFISNSQITDEGTVLNTVEYKDVGIILQVTPHISSDGLIELEVEPEISTLGADSVQISTGVYAPTYNKRSAATRVIVPNSKTVVIGGLMEDKEVEVLKKTPILSDIPLIGPIFSSTRSTTVKTELLIFLTPTLVSPSLATSNSSSEKKRTQLIEGKFSGRLKSLDSSEEKSQ